MIYWRYMLHDTLRDDMRTAMKSGDDVRLRTLRLAVSACTNALVEKKMKPSDMLDDESVVAVLRRLVKQREESAAQYRSAGRDTAADDEDGERAVLESYLPPGMSDDEVRAVVKEVLDSMGDTDAKNRGTVMKAVMERLRGRVSGSVAARIVGETA